MTYYLAIDIGASNGRHILSHIENERLVLEEIYRFDNNLTQSKDGLVWDIDSLFAEVLCGIKKCKDIGKIPKSIAIDTWGVDYVLLDENKKEIKPCYCYRDGRTNAVVDEVESLVFPAELYEPQFHGFAKPHSQIEKVIGFSLSPVSNATFFVAALRALPIL